MKIRIATFSAFLLLATLACAQKVVESSDKKKPKWANSLLERDYIIKAADGSDLQEAQQKSITLVKEEVVRSIAENVTSASTLNTDEDVKGNVSSTFRQSIMTKANRVPYVQGIALNTAEASYWEKIKDSKTKQNFYRFYIKVPFSRAQLGKLVAEFKEEDMKITRRIDALEAALASIESVEQIDAAVDELGGLAATLEDSRQERSRQLQSRYRALYESIVIADEGSSLGKVAYRLELGGKTIQSSRKPQVKSACAAIAQTNIGVSCSVAYRYDGCYNDIENFVEVLYRFGSKNVAQKFLIPLK